MLAFTKAQNDRSYQTYRNFQHKAEAATLSNIERTTDRYSRTTEIPGTRRNGHACLMHACEKKVLTLEGSKALLGLQFCGYDPSSRLGHSPWIPKSAAGLPDRG
jgi:hypothetical protein